MASSPALATTMSTEVEGTCRNRSSSILDSVEYSCHPPPYISAMQTALHIFSPEGEFRPVVPFSACRRDRRCSPVARLVTAPDHHGFAGLPAGEDGLPVEVSGSLLAGIVLRLILGGSLTHAGWSIELCTWLLLPSSFCFRTTFVLDAFLAKMRVISVPKLQSAHVGAHGRPKQWWCLLPIDFPATSSPRLTTSPMSTTSGMAMRLSVHELCSFGICHVALFRLQISAVEPASRAGAFERAASRGSDSMRIY